MNQIYTCSLALALSLSTSQLELSLDETVLKWLQIWMDLESTTASYEMTILRLEARNIQADQKQ